MSQDWYDDVLKFHEKFVVHIGDHPSIPPEQVKRLRQSIQREEFDRELMPAMWRDDIVAISDAIADTIYVLLGTAISYGIDIRPIWDAVHATNMAKEGGNKREDGKIMKPKGWTPPDIAGLLKMQGHDPG